MTYRGSWYGGDREDGASFEHRRISGGMPTDSFQAERFEKAMKESAKKRKKNGKKKKETSDEGNE